MATIPAVSKAALQDWIAREAEPITAADPTAVAEYVLEQLEKAEGKAVESQRTALEKDLNTFFEVETARFVSRLLAKVVPTPSEAVIDRATAVLSAQETILVELAQRVALHRRRVDRIRAAVAAAASGGDAQLRAQVQEAIKATRALSEEQVRVLNTVSTAHKAATAGLQRLQQRKQTGSSSAGPATPGGVAAGRHGAGEEELSDGEEPLLLGDEDDEDGSDGGQDEQEALAAWRKAEAATAAQFADADRAASVAQAAQDELAALQRRHDGADDMPIKAAPVLVQASVEPEGGEAEAGE